MFPSTVADPGAVADPDRLRIGRPQDRSVALSCVAVSCLALWLSGCAGAGAVQVGHPGSGAPASRADPPPTEPWWGLLGDPGLDALVTAALADAPTLDQAIARIDEARALGRIQAATGLPRISASAAASTSREPRDSGGTVATSTGQLDLAAAWEIDLFGRIRSGSRAAAARVDARTAEAGEVRLVLIADVAVAAVGLRTCHRSAALGREEIASRTDGLALTRRRVAAGFDAPIEAARAETGLASARTRDAARQQACAELTQSLVFLTGLPAEAVGRLMAEPESAAAPAAAPALVFPGAVAARVAAGRPGVAAAERERDAALAEIDQARAARLPRLDLGALLTGQWIRAAGSSVDAIASSFGPTLSATVFDGGSGAADVTAAEARYRGAEAGVAIAARQAVRDIEDALAAGRSARARQDTSGQALEAARFALVATEARRRTGAADQLELEDARRAFNLARDDALTADDDVAKAWITLMRATGAAALSDESPVP